MGARLVNPSLMLLPANGGLHYEDGEVCVYSMIGKDVLEMDRGTWYVFVASGSVIVSGSVLMLPGTYGCFLGGRLHSNHEAEVLVVQAKRFHGIPMIGGPIEEKGRLRYIDGCTDTGIIPPLKQGDPCLNHLHFPAQTKQTMHTHPDIRVGMVAKGYGWCLTPYGTERLLPGMQFIIMPENGRTCLGFDGQPHKVGEHCFMTEDQTMDVVAWHPSSTVGPTDEHHQMLAETQLVA